MRLRAGRAASAALAASLLVVAGGGAAFGKAHRAAPTVNISYLTLWPPPQVKIFQSAVNRYEQLHPNVHIQIRAVPFGDLLSTITTDALSSSAPTIDDIYDLWLPQLVQAGILAPAPTLYARDVRANYAASLVLSTMSGGKVYGYPNEVDDYELDYNIALFHKAGIASPPRTWAQLVQDAVKLRHVTRQGFSVITSWNSGVVHPWLALVQSDGGRLLTSTEHPLMTSPASVAALNLYETLIRDKATIPSLDAANASTTGPYLNNFVNGQSAMIIMADWWESDLESAMGANFKNVGVAPIPVGPNGNGSHTVYYSWESVVNGHATPAQQAAAWSFLKWVDSPASGTGGSSAMGNLLVSEGILPSRTSDIGAHSAQLNTPFMKPYVEGLKTAYPFPIVLDGVQLTNDVQTGIEAMEFGQQTPAATARSVQQELTALLGPVYHY
jgi:multiple sugar transport system substrate-binding protein